jgi:predicted helicase
MVDWPRTEAMPHMLAGENLAIMVGRAGQVIGSDEWDIVHASRDITEFNHFRRGGNNLFPLYLYPGVGKSDGSLFHTWPEGKGGRRPNLAPEFVETIAQATGLRFISDGRGDLDLSGEFGPEDVLAYIYAVFHCPEYRRRFDPMLKLDFPRIPPPGAAEPFAALAQLGHDLLTLHLLESPKLAKPVTEFVGGRNPEVEKVSWSTNTVWVDRAQTTGFKGVREDVWNFHIGGYQVCEKWLKDRKGRKLTNDDVAHYQKIVVALSETIRLMKEIDEVIEQHGGWPDAFQKSAV